MASRDQPVAVGEVFVQEIDERVAGYGLVGAVHRHLPEEVFRFGIQHDECSEPVPEVVQRIDALRVGARLIGRLDERTPQFDGVGQVAAPEKIAEMEVVFRREMRLPARRADDEAVSAHDLLRRWVPDDQLVVSSLGPVLPVDVRLLSRASAGCAEGDFAQPPHLAHQRGAFGRREDVDFVAGAFRVAHLAVGRQLPQQLFPGQRIDDRFYFVHGSFSLSR